MASDVQRVIKACSTCAQTTPKFLPGPSKLKPQIAERPFQRWGIDIVTMSKEAEYKYLITCVDYFTRWIEVGKWRTKKAQATCEWFTQEIIHRCPEVIISDRGGEFDSDFSKRLHQQGITHRRRSTTWTPTKEPNCIHCLDRSNCSSLKLHRTSSRDSASLFENRARLRRFGCLTRRLQELHFIELS